MSQSSSTLPDPSVSLAAARPRGQAARLAALRSYGILDTPVEGAFEDITRIASHVCGVPISVVNLIDEDRQWFKSEIGLGVRETPLDTSICAHAILETDFLEVHDTLLDDRFRDNPLVTGEPNLRFYAGALLKDAAGHALGTVCVLDSKPRELTEDQRAVLRALARQTMAQLELRRALLRAERARTYRSRLVAMAGLELKQPLSVMTVVIEELRAQAAPGDEQLQLASDAARTLGRDLGRLTEASREDADEDDPVFSEMTLDEALDPVRDTWSFAAARKGLHLEVDECALPLCSNAAMLRAILDNLVGNAIKYTPHGRVQVQSCPVQDGIEVEVIDTGIGIPADLGERIFEAFRQADPSSDGLGLGLSIAKRTADLLDCRLSMQSQPGEGSTFRLWIPAGRVSGRA